MSGNKPHISRKPAGRGSGGFGRPAEKPKDFKGSFKRLIGYLKPHRMNLLIVLICAIASTAFTIAAPKIMSKAMNKLQSSYMASRMLTEMSKGQATAIKQLNDKMGDIQKDAVDRIDDKLAESQTKAVSETINSIAAAQETAADGIAKNIAAAQSNAVDEIYKGIAIQLYQGTVKGQKTAVDKITVQMAASQKTLVAQMRQQMLKMQQMQQAGIQTPPMDPKTLEAIQNLLKLPMIDSGKDRQQKVNLTLQFINMLEALPSNGQTDKTSLQTAKGMLQLPMLDTVKSGSEKVGVIKKFLSIANGIGGSGQSSSMQLDAKTLNKALAKIPEIKDFNAASTSTGTMNKKTQDAIQRLLKLPMLSGIKDPAAKKTVLNKLLDIFASLPDMSTGSSGSKFNKTDLKTIKDLLALPDINSITDKSQKKTNAIKLADIFSRMQDMASGNSSAAPSAKFNKADLGTIKDLLALPDTSSITDKNQKKANAIKLVDIFSRMQDMSKGSAGNQSDTAMDPEQLKSVKDLLNLPVISTISGVDEKNKVTGKMLDIFGRMPDIGTATDNNSGTKMDTEEIKSLQEFLALPNLSSLTDPNQKADTAKKMIDLGKKMQSSMKDASTDPASNVKFTDAQIDSSLTAIRETNGKYDFHYIGTIILILIGIYVISALFSLTMGLVMSGVSQETVRDLRREVDEKLSRLPLKYFDMHAHGDILSRVTNDVDTIAGTLQQGLTQMITSVITIIGYMIMMLTISPVLTLIVIATLPLYIIVTTAIAKKSQKFFGVQQKELGDLSGHVEEMYTGHQVIKAFGREKNSIDEFEAINGRLKDAGWKAQFVSGIMYPLMNFISNLGYVGISIVGGIWITKSLLGLGDILAFIQYSRSSTMPIVQTANIANVIQSTVACAERVFEILDEEEEIPDRKDAIVLENPQGNVAFEHVDFRYTEDVPLIEDMNLNIKQGETIAIVGPTGAGKTTLVNLLMRFYEINSGRITVDGVNIKDIKRSELRRMFGMVLQDTWLYTGSIKDNIAYGRQDASMDQIVRAAKAAHADHFIRTLPQGYDTILNEEATNISQGQKQLLTIARAILADPTILILDEATSSVDTRTEVQIQKAMANLMRGRTSFVIAHRLSTIRDAKLILVMNNGKIIETGSHKELLEKGGFYADLYNSQFAGAEI